MPSELNIISDVFDDKIKFSDSHISLKLHEHFIRRINEIVHFTDSKMSISMLRYLRMVTNGWLKKIMMLSK